MEGEGPGSGSPKYSEVEHLTLDGQTGRNIPVHGVQVRREIAWVCASDVRLGGATLESHSFLHVDDRVFGTA